MLPIRSCTGCFACETACPKHCIVMKADNRGFLKPIINHDDCIHCGICEKNCPELNTSGIKTHNNGIPSAFAAFANDPETRYCSSSGGAFSIIAKRVLDEGGAVCGAAFSEDLSVKHIFAHSEEELRRLRGSKYVQSAIGDCYFKTKQMLERGEKVLFSGTPCQIAGLRTYLKNSYENLLTVDLICHGVPSEKAWREYLNEKQREHASKVCRASFRDKSIGWTNFSMSLSFENGDKYTNSLKNDPFLKAFLQNLCLKESCYNCNYKTIERCSDITLADCWGIEKLTPDWIDVDGVSLIIAQSEKGLLTLQKCASELTMKQIDINNAANLNGAMLHSVYKPPFYDYFFHKLGKTGFSKLTERCLNPNLLQRFERKMMLKMRKKDSD